MPEFQGTYKGSTAIFIVTLWPSSILLTFSTSPLYPESSRIFSVPKSVPTSTNSLTHPSPMRRTLIRLANPVSHIPAIPKPTNFTTTTPISTSKSTASSRPTRSKIRSSQTLSLEHFLLRSRVLNLYRTILRAIYKIPDKDARRDPVAHAKSEFARNKDVRETAQIRYLVSTGKAEWDGMRRYIDELATRAKG